MISKLGIILKKKLEIETPRPPVFKKIYTGERVARGEYLI